MAFIPAMIRQAHHEREKDDPITAEIKSPPYTSTTRATIVYR